MEVTKHDAFRAALEGYPAEQRHKSQGPAGLFQNASPKVMTIDEPTAESGKIIPAATNEKPPDVEHPLFSLRHVDKKYCISSCEKGEKASFVTKMHKLSSMSWRELSVAPSHGLGFEFIKTLDAKLPRCAPQGARAIAFRFHDKAPVVGYRDGNTFYAVWFDRQFKLYDHG